jgi:phosphoglucosamine mutase
VGLAFDGDADRMLAVDHTGSLVDGDHLMALFAADLQERGLLASDTVVVTVMTNLGMLLALEARGIQVHQTKVGDRHVLAAIEEGGFALGGEQSGHIIFRQLATTGDGILTGLQLLDLLRRRGRSLAELAGDAMTRLPQELVSVAVPDPDRLASAGAVWEEVAAVEAELGHAGRVLLRASGTEPVVRVMVEAQSADQARAAADRLCIAVRRQLGSA